MACSTTWPPPWSTRLHQGGAGVASSQWATISAGGRSASRPSDLGQDVERPQVIADRDDEPGSLDGRREPDGTRTVAGSQRFLGQERDAARHEVARRWPPRDTAGRTRRPRPAPPRRASPLRPGRRRRPSGAWSPRRPDRSRTRRRRARSARAGSSASRWRPAIQPAPITPSRRVNRSPAKICDSSYGGGLLELVVAARLRAACPGASA